MVDSTELERGITTASVAKDLPRLKFLALFLKVHERVDFFYVGAIDKGQYAQKM